MRAEVLVLTGVLRCFCQLQGHGVLMSSDASALHVAPAALVPALTCSCVMHVQGGDCCRPCQAHTLIVLSAAPDSSTALPHPVTAR